MASMRVASKMTILECTYLPSYAKLKLQKHKRHKATSKVDLQFYYYAVSILVLKLSNRLPQQTCASVCYTRVWLLDVFWNWPLLWERESMPWISTPSPPILSTRDRREYQYRIESTDTKAASISISLDPGISGVSVSVSVSIQRPEHFLEGLGRILIK